jgi:hypothetical protein
MECCDRREMGGRSPPISDFHWLARKIRPSTRAVGTIKSMMPSAPTNLEEGLVLPVREKVAHGSQGWQSYATLTRADVVDCDSRRFLDGLARLETQLGSLKAERPALDRLVPASAKVEIHRPDAAAMLGGYATKGLDISWDDELARKVVETGRGYELEAQVMALYRLRTALPAGLLARVGAILGGGSARLIEELRAYFEATGLASQIMVDVLELRGLEAAPRGSWDVARPAKLTLPIVKALGMLAPSRREWLWQSLKERPIQELVVRRAVYEVEDIGALAACTQLARDLIEGTWQSLDPILDDSPAKSTVRAFGRCVLDWHEPS